MITKTCFNDTDSAPHQKMRGRFSDTGTGILNRYPHHMAVLTGHGEEMRNDRSMAEHLAFLHCNFAGYGNDG